MRRFYKSRLQTVEEKKALKQAFLFIFLTLILVSAVVFLGIPALIKFSSFLGEVRPQEEIIREKEEKTLSAPKIQPLPEFTKESKIDIKGYAQPDNGISIYVNQSKAKKVTADSKGEFLAKDISLVVGENKIKIIAEDSEGNQSNPLATILLVDISSPTLQISSPSDGQTFYEEEKEITVVGQVNENSASVYVNNHFAILDDEGNFSEKIDLSEGENIIKITAEDKAGNREEKEVKVTYVP